MSSVNYIFGDALTGNPIEEINLFGVSLKETLDGGEFRASFHLDQTGKDNDQLLAATIPGKSFCVVERDGRIIGDYIIWTRTYQSQAKVLQLFGIPFKDYPETRHLLTDYSATNVEQRNIFLDLYQLMQADESSIKVQLPPYFPDKILKTVSFIGTEYKTFRQVLDDIADAPDGFDWLIRTHRTANIYYRKLDIGYPQIGGQRNIGIPVFEYISPSGTGEGGGGNIINYWSNDSMAGAGTHFFGIGNGEGSTMLTSTIIHDDLIQNGFPRYDVTVDRKDVSDINILTANTFMRAMINKAPSSTITAEVRGESDPEFGSYGIGDFCRVVIKDQRYPQGLDKYTRILGWEYYPPEDSNIELVRLNFEGEE